MMGKMVFRQSRKAQMLKTGVMQLQRFKWVVCKYILQKPVPEYTLTFAHELCLYKCTQHGRSLPCFCFWGYCNRGCPAVISGVPVPTTLKLLAAAISKSNQSNLLYKLAVFKVLIRIPAALSSRCVINGIRGFVNSNL